MEGPFEKLEEIEKAHSEFFIENNIHAIDYVFASQNPLLLNFNKEMGNRNKLPDEIKNKINAVIVDFNSKSPL